MFHPLQIGMGAVDLELANTLFLDLMTGNHPPNHGPICVTLPAQFVLPFRDPAILSPMLLLPNHVHPEFYRGFHIVLARRWYAVYLKSFISFLGPYAGLPMMDDMVASFQNVLSLDCGIRAVDVEVFDLSTSAGLLPCGSTHADLS
jgi:hypothetical protein